MTEKAAKARLEDARLAEEQSREAELVAAADEGTGAYFRAAGPWRLVWIFGTAIVVGFAARWRLSTLDYLGGSLLAFFALFILSMVTSAIPWGVRSRARSEAKSLRRSGQKLLKKFRARLDDKAAAEVEQALAAVDAALASGKAAQALSARNRLDGALEQHLSFGRKTAAREYTESIGGAILVALLLRAFVFEPFHIPSGSMIPTLLVGDFIFVNKMSYGMRAPFTNPATLHKLGEAAPARGDVVVFTVPHSVTTPGPFLWPWSPSIDYVKRVVGLPGDRIDVRDNQIWVNGELQARTDVGDYTYTDRSEYADESEVTAREFTEVLGGKPHRTIVRKDEFRHNGGSFLVEPGKIFVMGDNRDNSQDSRVDGGPGQVPFSYIKGRASVIWISFGGPHGIRFSRMFQSVK
jgi:signal peptidase I